jgi:hypothetical protein
VADRSVDVGVNRLREPPAPVLLMVARERSASRLLIAYILAGLAFMLLPGTFLGVWNLISISSHRIAGSMSPAWLQAHGHAQVFGWVGTFILGIGFYSIPKMAGAGPLSAVRGWLALLFWVAGAALRWLTNVYLWHWRIALPLSAALELIGFVIFLVAVSDHHRRKTDKPVEVWMLAVFAATAGFAFTLLLNLAGAILLASRGNTPAFAPAFDRRFLTLAVWGALVPFVWGFSARWLPIFLGLRTLRSNRLLVAIGLLLAGIVTAMFGTWLLSGLLLVCAVATAINALRLFECSERPAKTQGIHPAFAVFVRIAYLWLLIGGALSIYAAAADRHGGIWGASRHAITVGFIALMVFNIGQRVLPAFSGMRLLFSKQLMLFSSLLLVAGCTLRVFAEILAYEGHSSGSWTWSILPVSAVAELIAVTLFAVNLSATFLSTPPSARAS